MPTRAALLALLLLAPPGAASAQEPGVLAGTVRSARNGAPLPGAAVAVPNTDLVAVTGPRGTFRLAGVPPGRRTVRVTLLGYRTRLLEVAVRPGAETRLEVRLEPRPVEIGGIEVVVLRPDLHPQARLDAREVRRANPADVGDVLRTLGGVDAVRRGPLGLDPVVRGLRETQVGSFLDGTRMFPAGPARMDSPFTHLDPSAIASLEVVKGPYALTWGAGNLTAIRVRTRELPAPGRAGAHGGLALGYDSNRKAAEGSAWLAGRRGAAAWWLHGAWREGHDYADGAGAVVPGDYRSGEVRGKVGLDVGEGTRLVLGAGLQDQGPIDYPGRLLDADYFRTLNLSASLRHRGRGRLASFTALAYRNRVRHGMSNGGKPTARPDPDRVPPFPLDVRVRSEVAVTGGRLSADLRAGEAWMVEVGGDLYTARRDAVRTIGRRDTGTLLFRDLMWPRATITDGGFFARARGPVGERLRLSLTARLDLVAADADTVGEFFAEHVATELRAKEANVSGAVTAAVELDPRWTLSLGLGSAVRTADASERYSDRIPSSRAQTSAEFVGNPILRPERSTQADLWIDARYPDLALEANLFVRRVDDYVTLEPTDLPRRLPLSPETVFRYVNGRATFWGVEASAAVGLGEAVTLTAGAGYLWGRDDSLGEPALGVTPLRGTLALRFEPPAGTRFVEGRLRGAARQTRVAATRNEGPTDGYLVGDLRAGFRLLRGATLRVGVDNLWDRAYVNHLNARNPFTGAPVPEPGRVVFLDLVYAF